MYLCVCCLLCLPFLHRSMDDEVHRILNELRLSLTAPASYLSLFCVLFLFSLKRHLFLLQKLLIYKNKILCEDD